MSDKKHIQQKLSLLPKLPGCYLMKDSHGHIIYIGKAKNLKNRVRSYFTSAHDGKTQLLVNDIADFETIVTNTNKEALLLEISLIKKHQPKYNIKLKEGTMYPYLKITNERDPQLLIVNQIVDDGGLYFGPYPNVTAATQTQQLLQKVYPLRRCGKNEKRACFYYHLGQCIGCCDHDVSVNEYEDQITKIQQFLNGNVSTIKQDLIKKMQEASNALDFEKAMDYRDQIKYIEETVERQSILSKNYTNQDVFGYYVDRGMLSIQVFLLRQQSIIKREASIFSDFVDPEDDVLSFIVQFYENQNHPIPSEIIIPDTLDATLLAQTLNTKITVPKKQKKKHMLDLAIKNSELALVEKFQLDDLKSDRTIGAAQELANYLGIDSATTIESFDHSNIQGTNPVSGMVVYTNGMPNKKAYRKYKIKTVKGSNEYATTQEVISRRYSRLLIEKKPLPDLILMDGGDIQVNAAKDILMNELNLDIPVAGMVKNDKHKTASLIFGDPLHTVELPTNSSAFRLIQRIQEEVHRYSVTFHRQLRSKNSLSSQLDTIDGVGPKTKKKLLLHFKTIRQIQEATLEELTQMGINKRTSQSIIDWAKQENSKQ